jgi:hypothetical protein
MKRRDAFLYLGPRQKNSLPSAVLVKKFYLTVSAAYLSVMLPFPLTTVLVVIISWESKSKLY